jgi:integration host factor subunit beta
MLKSDLVNILVEKRGVTQKQAEATIETIFESMRDALCRGENIEIRGLGAFHVKSYQGYQGRNPKTGQIIPVKPKRGLLFRTGKELRDRVNRPPAQEATNVMATGANNAIRPDSPSSLDTSPSASTGPSRGENAAY